MASRAVEALLVVTLSETLAMALRSAEALLLGPLAALLTVALQVAMRVDVTLVAMLTMG